MRAKILGVWVGECRSEFVMMQYREIIGYEDFVPNKNMYKIFPDFPKEKTMPNQLKFNSETGELSFYKCEIVNNFLKNYSLIFETTLKLTNLKGK